jgi:hypothetical protein
METLGTLLRACEQKVSKRTPNAAVAVVKRMNRHEPQIRDTGPHHKVGAMGSVEPAQKSDHFLIDTRRGRGFEVHTLSTISLRDNLHRTAQVFPAGADADFADTAVTGRK